MRLNIHTHTLEHNAIKIKRLQSKQTTKEGEKKARTNQRLMHYYMKELMCV